MTDIQTRKLIALGSLLAIATMITAAYMIGYNYCLSSFKYTDPRSYQIQCYPDSVVLYDGEKRIGVIDYDDNSNFSNLILNDNK